MAKGDQHFICMIVAVFRFTCVGTAGAGVGTGDSAAAASTAAVAASVTFLGLLVGTATADWGSMTRVSTAALSGVSAGAGVTSTGVLSACCARQGRAAVVTNTLATVNFIIVHSIIFSSVVNIKSNCEPLQAVLFGRINAIWCCNQPRIRHNRGSGCVVLPPPPVFTST